MFRFEAKDGDTKVMLVYIFGKYGENQSVFGLYFEEKWSVFGRNIDFFLYRPVVSSLLSNDA